MTNYANSWILIFRLYLKTTLVCLICIFFSFSAQTQNNSVYKELGLVFNNVERFGLAYKFGSKSALWNVGLVGGSGFYRSAPSNIADQKTNTFGIEIHFGREFRKPLNSKLNLVYGADLLLTLLLVNQKTILKPPIVGQDSNLKFKSYSPGIRFNLGANYRISSRFSFGILTNIPTITYLVETAESQSGTNNIYKTERTLLNYGISNINSSLIFSYIF